MMVWIVSYTSTDGDSYIQGVYRNWIDARDEIKKLWWDSVEEYGKDHNDTGFWVNENSKHVFARCTDGEYTEEWEIEGKVVK